jgi:molybdate transport system permease protein
MFNTIEIQAIQLSLKVAIYSAMLTLPFALFLGNFMARRQFIGKSVIEGILNLPLVLPPVTTGYILLLVLGSNSFLGEWYYKLFGEKLHLHFRQR